MITRVPTAATSVILFLTQQGSGPMGYRDVMDIRTGVHVQYYVWIWIAAIPCNCTTKVKN